MSHNRRINHDILLEILSLSPQPVLTAFMQTCRTLYHDGAKEMLRRRVLIKSATSLESFLHFLNADNYARVSYLRDLNIQYLRLHVITQETAQSLCHCVGMMSGLKCLSMNWVEEFHDMCPDLGPALAKLKTIEVLTFRFIGVKTLNTLRQMRSPFRILTLQSTDYRIYQNRLPLDSIELVAHLSPTLEELKCMFISQHHSEVVYPKFPRMRRLQISRIHEPLITRYHAAFPNLIDLTIMCDLASRSTSFETVLRERNLRLLSQSSGDHHSGLWKEIHSFTGDLTVVYSLGVPCRIDKLHLGDISAGSMDVLTAVLSETTPKHLSLKLLHSSWQRNIEPRFVALMRSPRAVCIRSLELSVKGLIPMNASIEEIFVSVGKSTHADVLIQGDLLSALKAISLEKFTLIIYDGSGIFPDGEALLKSLDYIMRQVPSLGEASVERSHLYASLEPPERIVRAVRSDSSIIRFLQQ